MTQPTDLLSATDAHGVATLTLTRPAARNALSLGLMTALVTELDRHWINAHPRMTTYRATTP